MKNKKKRPLSFMKLRKERIQAALEREGSSGQEAGSIEFVREKQ